MYNEAAASHALALLEAVDLTDKTYSKQLRNSIGALPPTAGMTSHTGFAALAVRYAFERSAWKEAAMLPPLNTPFKQADAIIWFARAIGAARSGDIPAAKQDLDQISKLRQELALGDPYWAEQVGIQETAASAWIALGEKNPDQAMALMRTAADREELTEKHIAMENRLSPMRELKQLLALPGSADSERPALSAARTLVKENGR